MATYTVRGTAYNIIYTYTDETGKKKQHWETYSTELEAMQRKAYIDYLQKAKLHQEILKAVVEYKRKRELERAINEQFRVPAPIVEVPSGTGDDNMTKTFREFAEKWLPFHARKERFSPNSYDSYRSNLENHIYPFFGDRVMSSITAEDIDNFIDHLSMKPCRGPKSYGKRPDNIPTLCKCALCNKTVDCGQHVHPGPTPYEPHRWQYTESHVSNGVDNHTSTCTAKCVDCGYSYSLGSYVYSHEYRLIDNNHSTGTVHIYTYKCRDCGQKKNIRYTCPGNPCIPMP